MDRAIAEGYEDQSVLVMTQEIPVVELEALDGYEKFHCTRQILKHL